VVWLISLQASLRKVGPYALGYSVCISAVKVDKMVAFRSLGDRLTFLSLYHGLIILCSCFVIFQLMHVPLVLNQVCVILIWGWELNVLKKYGCGYGDRPWLL